MLVNARTGHVLAEAVELADTRATRRRGLLGRDRLDPSNALVIVPCFAIHTFGMRFPIDVLFLNRHGIVVKIVHEVPAARMAICVRARAVVECAAGTLRNRDVRLGDRLYLSASEAPAGAAVSWPISA